MMKLPSHLRLLKLTRLPKDKDAQVDITVREMIRIAVIEAWNPEVRWLVHHARLPYYTHEEKAEAFTSFIRKQFPFELDPDDVELVRTPSYYARELRAGRARGGDCDDLALLLATMLYAEGFGQLAFVVMATSPVVRDFRHVFVAAFVGQQWRFFDPSVSVPYSTDGLRRRWYHLPWDKGPPRL